MERTAKKHNRYKLSLEAFAENTDELAPSNKIEIDFENHDDVFKVIELVKGKKIFTKDSEATEFAIGLKLFSEVVLRNRELSLFDDLKPAIGEFMKKLKAI